MIDFNKFPSPCYVVDKEKLIKNLEILKMIKDRTGCHVLLAQKAFSTYSLYPLIAEYLDGVTSSSLHEARLGFEKMKKEVHIYAPAYREDEFDEILDYSDHIVFNSYSQWITFKEKVKHCGKPIECGIRINPEYSEIETDIYNPCSVNSRMGMILEEFQKYDFEGIDGLHFHTMCEQNSDTLWRTLQVVDEKFGSYLKKLKWINFGGGHHITRKDYDIETLVKSIAFIKDKYNLQVYLEPGEAVALNAGYLVSTVLDITTNGMNLAILDTSAACHMPDVLEMPYRPKVLYGGNPGELSYTYRFGGPTCLAGDIIGEYSFDKPLKVGDKVVFCDMAIYTMVKNNTFNGIGLPAIGIYTKEEGEQVLKTFGYEDFKSRL